ncbi:MAG: hypothetical protein MUO24_02200 [Desulfobacterales bacterium]|nr:hypothetical protein [Desulfobacterales bacterium]
MTQEKTDEQILFPEVEVGGIKVRPWTLKQFFGLLPIFMRMAEVLKEKGVALDQFEGLKDDEEGVQKLFAILSNLSDAVPEINEVIARTVELPIKEVEAMEFDRSISIALMIIIQNVERIKNFSGLTRSAVGALTGKATD